MAKIDKFAGIKRVALLIAYDNGMINRFCSEEKWLESLDPVLGADGVDEADLEILDGWCMTLSDEEADLLGCGLHPEMDAIVEKAPNPKFCGIFEDIFDA